jgi:hypothetical protein
MRSNVSTIGQASYINFLDSLPYVENHNIWDLIILRMPMFKVWEPFSDVMCYGDLLVALGSSYAHKKTPLI